MVGGLVELFEADKRRVGYARNLNVSSDSVIVHLLPNLRGLNRAEVVHVDISRGLARALDITIVAFR